MTALELALSPEVPADHAAVEQLEARAFGPGRFVRTAYRLREGAAHDRALSFVARVSTLVVGSVRQTRIVIGPRGAACAGALLGPLTVDPAFRSRGIGRLLVERAVDAASGEGLDFVLLVGDAAYYGRMGFVRARPGRLVMPGPVDPARLLLRELNAGTLDTLAGPVRSGAI
jgi:predicted N-acetyltransferase YhbS